MAILIILNKKFDKASKLHKFKFLLYFIIITFFLLIIFLLLNIINNIFIFYNNKFYINILINFIILEIFFKIKEINIKKILN